MGSKRRLRQTGTWRCALACGGFACVARDVDGGADEEGVVVAAAQFNEEFQRNVAIKRWVVFFINGAHAAFTYLAPRTTKLPISRGSL